MKTFSFKDSPDRQKSFKYPLPKIDSALDFIEHLPWGETYKASIREVLTPDQAKEIMLKIPVRDFDKNKEDYEMSLYDRWAEEKELSQNTLADTTDFFIRASIPGFSNDPVYFVRDKDGGWSSIDTTDIFMSGTLILPEQDEE